MSNQLYNVGRRILLNQFNWVGQGFRLFAYEDINYTFDENDERPYDFGPYTYSAISLPLTGKFITTRGFAKSDPALFQTPTPMEVWKFFVLTLNDNAENLFCTTIAYYDTGVGLPHTTNGQDEMVMPDWLAQQGWFRP